MTTSIREFIRENRKELVITVVLSILFNLYLHFKEITNPYIIYPDVPLFYILNILVDNTLFSADPYIQTTRNSLIMPMLVVNPLFWITAILSKLFPLSSLLVLPSIIYNLIAILFIFGIGIEKGATIPNA